MVEWRPRDGLHRSARNPAPRHNIKDIVMPLVPLRLLLDHAAENDYGLAAFNVNNMEQIQAIMEAARETESPVIVQATLSLATAIIEAKALRPVMR